MRVHSLLLFALIRINWYGAVKKKVNFVMSTSDVAPLSYSHKNAYSLQIIYLTIRWSVKGFYNRFKNVLLLTYIFTFLFTQIIYFWRRVLKMDGTILFITTSKTWNNDSLIVICFKEYENETKTSLEIVLLEFYINNVLYHLTR